MEERINQYLNGRRIIIEYIDIYYTTDVHYCNQVYTIYFFFHDLNLKISYSINENIYIRLNQILDFLYNNYIPEKIKENVNLKVYFRTLKIQKIKSKL